MTKKSLVKLTNTITEIIDFPSGSSAEINDYLAGEERRFISNINNYVVISTGEYVLKSLKFDHKWSGYEDHEFFLVAEIEESDEFFKARIERQAQQKEVEAKNLKIRQERKKEEDGKRRALEIQELKQKLAELEKSK